MSGGVKHSCQGGWKDPTGIYQSKQKNLYVVYVMATVCGCWVVAR